MQWASDASAPHVSVDRLTDVMALSVQFWIIVDESAPKLS